MSLWLVLALMTAAALALALAPLLRGPRTASGRREHNLAVYRAQLEELKQEQARGLLGAREAQAAELEIKRRMLAQDAGEGAHASRGSRALRLGTALAVLIGLPALSGVLYWQLGSPDQPGMPFAERAGERPQVAGEGQPEDGGVPPVATMVARLEARVEADPDDLGGWLRLGRAYELTDRPARAVEAYRAALALRNDAPEIHAALAQAAIAAAGGVVSEPARAAIERALALDPTNPRARFYRGLAEVQRGERERALSTWADLLRDTPADAPWLEPLRARATALAEDLGRDPESVLPDPAPAAAAAPADGPSPEERRAAADMAPEEREEMIRGMVEGLAARLEDEPDDAEGWRMLARSYGVLGEDEKAAEAAARVAELLPEDAAAQVAYAESLLALEDDAAPLSDEAVAQLRRVIEVDADNAQALFHLGRAAAERGETGRAEQYWQRLLAQIPEDTPARRQLESLIERLGAGSAQERQ